MNYFIFGGSGFIGTHLIESIKEYDPAGQIYNFDLLMPGEITTEPDTVPKIDGVIYQRVDVRKPIEVEVPTSENDIIFNLAAIHKTPGHKDNEYFDTNIAGAENVTKWAKKNNINTIVFTSSISIYGSSQDLKSENSTPTPTTSYGVSKLLAEDIHKHWYASSDARRLYIVRPGIVYGTGEHSNMTRLYSGIKKGYFFYVGRNTTIKACIYVKELTNILLWELKNKERFDVINCTYEPAYTIKQICNAIKKSTSMHRWILLIPSWILLPTAHILKHLGGKKLGIHPARVKKLMISTNIDGTKLKNSTYEWKYSLEDSFSDWFKDCNKKGLF